MLSGFLYIVQPLLALDLKRCQIASKRLKPCENTSLKVLQKRLKRCKNSPLKMIENA